jgi:hypothetical protein
MLDALGTNPNAADDLIGVYEWMIGCALASGDAR